VTVTPLLPAPLPAAQVVPVLGKNVLKDVVISMKSDLSHSGTASTGVLTTWTPQPCCWNNVDVASTP